MGRLSHGAEFGIPFNDCIARFACSRSHCDYVEHRGHQCGVALTGDSGASLAYASAAHFCRQRQPRGCVTTEAAAQPLPLKLPPVMDADEPMPSSTASCLADISASSPAVPDTASGPSVVEAPHVSQPAAPPAGELRLRWSVGLPMRVALDSVSPELKSAFIALSRSFELGPRPTTPVPFDLTYREGKTFVWNTTRGAPSSVS